MADLTSDELAKWDRRRRNLRILIAADGKDPTNLAREISLSPNTLTKFLNGSSPTMSPRTAEKVLPKLGLRSLDQLDTDNPINDPRVRLERLARQLDAHDLERLVGELEVRFAKNK